MKKEIGSRFTDIEKRLSAIETGISSLQPRDDSIKESEPSPYQEDESGPKISLYQSC